MTVISWPKDAPRGPFDRNVAAEVRKDLTELAKITDIPLDRALAYVDGHERELQELYNRAMSIEEITDYVIVGC